MDCDKRFLTLKHKVIWNWLYFWILWRRDLSDEATCEGEGGVVGPPPPPFTCCDGATIDGSLQCDGKRLISMNSIKVTNFTSYLAYQKLIIWTLNQKKIATNLQLLCEHCHCIAISEIGTLLWLSVSGSTRIPSRLLFSHCHSDWRRLNFQKLAS